MRFDSISASDRAMEDKLKKDLKNVEAEQERLKREQERLEGEKQQILKQLGELQKDRNPEDLLAMVYQQRRGK